MSTANTLPISRGFTQTVESLRYGEVSDELNRELQALVKKCQDTGRAGAITLTINIKPTKSGPFEITDDIKVKMPKAEKGSSMMFPTPEGNLQRNDPRQGDLELRTVDSSPAAESLRKVS